MKKIFSVMLLAVVIIFSISEKVSAQDIWCYSYSNSSYTYDYYIDTNKIFDSRPNYYVSVIVVNSTTGKLASKQFWNFSNDEGSIWYETGQESGKISDSAVATAVYNKMKQNLHLAKRGAPY